MLTAQQLITKYRLKPHPEGGHFLETYRSSELLTTDKLPPRFTGQRCFSTAIYFLLEAEQFSAFHRIKADELWHFYAGAGLHIYVLHPDGKGEILKLGNDIDNGYSFQLVVPAGAWFASKPAAQGAFSFVGCTVAPGFDFADFELAEKERLLRDYPQHQEWIHRLAIR